MGVDPGAEGQHEPTDQTAWEEAHRLDVVVPPTSDRAASALSLQISRHPNRSGGVVSFLAAYLRVGHLPIVISDLEVPMPEQRWEIRSSGLWADHICESPLEHWSYGLEAFALAISEPRELVDTGMGDRVPLGWEMEFEATSSAAAMGPESYSQAGTAHGLMLTAEGETPFEGLAMRTHWWSTGGPVELNVGGRHRPVYSSCALPAYGGFWELDAGEHGMRARWI